MDRRRNSARFRTARRFAWALMAVAFAASCSGADVEYEYPTDPRRRTQPKGSVLADDGELTIFSNERTREDLDAGGSGGIGVNAFLWRATLDTISFMPVASADAFGGVIITDWHSTPEAPNERFKMNVYILGRALRADGVKVAVFRQVQDASGWRDATLPPETGSKIEDAILTKARQLRSESAEGQ